jgi:hypothetical protein
MTKLFEGLRRDNNLLGLSALKFARGATTFVATLNAVHAFRDGNGRSQLAFVSLLGKAAGHPLHLDRMMPQDFLAAMITSFRATKNCWSNRLPDCSDRNGGTECPLSYVGLFGRSLVTRRECLSLKLECRRYCL